MQKIGGNRSKYAGSNEKKFRNREGRKDKSVKEINRYGRKEA